MNICERLRVVALTSGLMPPYLDAVEATQPIINVGDRVGRNQPCPCGSGLNFKRCHLPKAQANGKFVGRRKSG